MSTPVMPDAGAGPIVETEKLNKRFDGVHALSEVDLRLRPGHIIGLLGSNGSGKSTLLRHMVGIYLPTEGSCRVFGVEAGRLGDGELARIGYVHQEAQLLDWMSAGQLIRYAAAHYPHWNGELEAKLLDLYELKPYGRVGKLSPGQRQKLSILLAVCFEPELLILDEPASALDPIARRQFLELLLEIIQDQRRTIIISSHILSDIEKVIDQVLIMDRGRILKDCSFDDLLEDYVKLELQALGEVLPDPLPLQGVLSCERNGALALVIARRDELDPDGLAERLNCRVVQRRLTLEEIYPLVLEEGRLREARRPPAPYRGF